MIIAGGKGTRMQSRLGSLPKNLAEIAGRPLLEHQLLLAKKHGFEDILLLLGHGAEAIRDFAGHGSRWGLRIACLLETVPRGTAGAVLDALPALDGRFLVVYGDTMLNVDLARFWQAHCRAGAAASLLLHPNSHPHDSDLVEVDESGRITAFHPYPHPPGRYFANLVNAALYVVERDALLPWRDMAGPADFAKRLFPEMLRHGAFLYGYRSPEYIKDAGTPERLDQVIADAAAGAIDRGSLETAAPAVFLDRDGTINVEIDRVTRPQDLRLIHGAAAAIRRLNRSGYRAVLVTNQPVVARGDCTEAELREIHNKLETLLGAEQAYLDGIYACIHHPDRGFPGERPELKIRCACRKPETGLIRQAALDLGLDLARSWMIGDSTVDVRTALNAGIRSILVRTGYAGADGRYEGEPAMVCDSLPDAVDFLLRNPL